MTEVQPSGNNGGACVEVADNLPGVAVRDSKDQTGPALTLISAAWSTFVEARKA